ncbi:MAG: hypothetical protein NVV57_06315 [Demequina sp.]|nr:hypothetical protein [Demequina sp.]
MNGAASARRRGGRGADLALEQGQFAVDDVAEALERARAGGECAGGRQGAALAQDECDGVPLARAVAARQGRWREAWLVKRGRCGEGARRAARCGAGCGGPEYRLRALAVTGQPRGRGAGRGVAWQD